MENRQKEMEKPQDASVKIIRYVRYGIAAMALLGLLIIFVQNLGFPEQISETVPAFVITAEGQTLDISITLRGEVTNYPFKPGKMSMGDQITVFIGESDEKLMRLVPVEMDQLYYSRTEDAVCVLSCDRSHLLLETDLQKLFPDMESGTCLVYFDNGSFDLPSEFAEHFTMLN